jgi:predicted secreted hydrolase
MKKILLGLGILLVILIMLAIFFGKPEVYIDQPQARFQAVSTEGFKRAEGPREWVFPDDYGPHPEYQTEWWYYTGNLEGPDKQGFGYQLTFFRRGLIPPPQPQEGSSSWRTSDVFMAHFALTDFETNQHYYFEKFARGSADLAGAMSNPFQVWTENWGVYTIAENQLQLTAEQDDIKINLNLTDNKGLTFHGDQGYSQKGPEDGNASYYFSQTRLDSAGTVSITGEEVPVTGLSWMDHEFSTSALSAGQTGWDWFSIQLDDGSELMVFQIRRDDDSIDPYSSGTFITPAGETINLDQDAFDIEVLDTWKSPSTSSEYPAAWNIVVPELDLSIEIIPVINDQELELSFVYWEGAVLISGTSAAGPISGRGYVELTGYLRAFNLDF